MEKKETPIFVTLTNQPTYEKRFRPRTVFVLASAAPCRAGVDVYLNGAWKTILVASLGAGGRGLFALDITDPLNFDENDVLWEFKVDSDITNGSNELGFILGKPKIVRLNNGRWGVIVGNGYNSASQKAQLIILDAEDGSIIRVIDTGVGNATASNGLAEPTALDANLAKICSDRAESYVYGDLLSEYSHAHSCSES